VRVRNGRMDREMLTTDQQAAQLWDASGRDAFDIVQRRISEANDRIRLDDARYWLDVETRLYTLSQALRAA
jgi:hypothetical protein